MKKLVALVLVMALALTCFAGCGKQEDKLLEKILKEGKITMSTSPDYAPYEFKDLDGNIIGADIAVGKYIAEYLGVELEILPMDFAACQTAVYTGKVDFSISGYAPNDERAENATFSAPYSFVDTKQGIIIKKDQADKLNSADAFDGLKVAAQNGSLQYDLANEQLKGVTIEQISEINTGTMMLKSDKVAGLVSSDDTGWAICDVNPELTFSSFYFDWEDQGTVALIVKDEMSLKAEIDKALAKAKDEGLYQKWLAEAETIMEDINA